MATSYIGAKRIASKNGFEIVYHDFETGEYGACPRGQPQGHFDEVQRFHEHVCLYFPASMRAVDMEDAEDQKFADDPYWQERSR